MVELEELVLWDLLEDLLEVLVVEVIKLHLEQVIHLPLVRLKEIQVMDQVVLHMVMVVEEVVEPVQPVDQH